MTVRWLWPLLCGWLLLVPAGAAAHEFQLDAVVSTFVKLDGDGQAHLLVRAPLYLFREAKFPSRNGEIDLDAAAPALERATASLREGVQLLEDGRALVPASAAARLSLPSDRAFEGYESALAHIAAAPEAGTRIVVDQGYVDAHFVYRPVAAAAVHALRTDVARELGSYLKVTVRYLPPAGASRALVVKGGVGTVDLNPSLLAAARGFVGLGIAHIVTGYDHLLFLLCLVIPLRGWRALLTVVTAFTVAHSLTLLGASAGLTPRGEWFAPFVETVIAASIVFTALENIVGVAMQRRLLLTLLFGLVHGFGFSYGLQEDLQFAGTHLLAALLAFNVGIELGQLLVLAFMLPLLALVTRYLLPGRTGAIVLSALLAHTGWHWMEERWDTLVRTPWPALDAASLPPLLFWLAGLVLVVGAAVLAARRWGPAMSLPQPR